MTVGWNSRLRVFSVLETQILELCFRKSQFLSKNGVDKGHLFVSKYQNPSLFFVLSS